MTGLLRRLWDWLGREPPRDDTPNSTCPLCGREVVIAPTLYHSRFAGTVRFPATREERIAACPEHGPGSAEDSVSDAPDC